MGEKYVEYLREEIEKRGYQYNPKDWIRKLGKQLLKIELTIQQKRIKEQTGNQSPTKDTLNKKTYLPLCQSAGAEYEIH